MLFDAFYVIFDAFYVIFDAFCVVFDIFYGKLVGENPRDSLNEFQYFHEENPERTRNNQKNHQTLHKMMKNHIKSLEKLVGEIPRISLNEIQYFC
jgi:hypothetical protein